MAERLYGLAIEYAEPDRLRAGLRPVLRDRHDRAADRAAGGRGVGARARRGGDRRRDRQRAAATRSRTPASSPATCASRCASWSRTAGRPDVLVVDPPRAGLSQKVVRRIIEAAPEADRLRLLQPDDARAERRAAGRGRLRAPSRAAGRHVPADAAHRVRGAARASRPRVGFSRACAPSRSATKQLSVEEHPDPEPGRRRGPGPGQGGRDQRRRHAPAARAATRRPRARRRTSPGSSSPARSSRCGPGAERFKEGDRVMGDRRRRRPGGAGGRPRADADAGARQPRAGRRPAACPRCSRPRTTRSSRRPGCEPGERLLVHGGAGGVGTAAIQLGRAAGRPRDRDRPQSRPARPGGRVRRRGDRARGLRRARSVRRDPRAGRRAQPARQPRRAGHAAAGSR